MDFIRHLFIENLLYRLSYRLACIGIVFVFSNKTGIWKVT